MADVVMVVMLVCLSIVASIGTVLNGMTMYVLLRDKLLRKKLTSVRWLMFGESFSETLLCTIGAPLMFANILVGHAPPFTTMAIVCYPCELIGFGAAYVAIWYQTILALTRLVAIIAPVWYRNYVRKSAGQIAMMAFPWFMGYIVYVVGAITKAYHIHSTPGSGTCGANPYDNSLEAASRYRAYVLTDTIVHCWVPMLLGLLCYGIIYAKKWLRRFSNQHGHRVSGVDLAHVSHDEQSVADDNNAANAGGTLAIGPLHHPNKNAGDLARIRRTAARDKKVKLLAIAYVANVCLVFPGMGIVWGLNLYGWLSLHASFVPQILDVMNYMAFPINPLLYLIISADFRFAFRHLLGKQK